MSIQNQDSDQNIARRELQALIVMLEQQTVEAKTADDLKLLVDVYTHFRIAVREYFIGEDMAENERASATVAKVAVAS